MTTSEWLQSYFGVWDEGGVKHFSPMPNNVASADFFIATFGSQLESAISAGTSTYSALKNNPGGTRGWELYFDDWKQRGILD